MKKMKGSALIWCMVVLVVLSIITLVALNRAAIYYQKASEYAADDQLDNNAESAIDFLRSQLESQITSGGGYKRVFFEYQGSSFLDGSKDRNTGFGDKEKYFFNNASSAEQSIVKNARSLERYLLKNYLTNTGRTVRLDFNFDLMKMPTLNTGNYVTYADLYITNIDEIYDLDEYGMKISPDPVGYRATIVAECKLSDGLTEKIGATFVTEPVYISENTVMPAISTRVLYLGVDDRDVYNPSTGAPGSSRMANYYPGFYNLKGAVTYGADQESRSLIWGTTSDDKNTTSITPEETAAGYIITNRDEDGKEISVIREDSDTEDCGMMYFENSTYFSIYQDLHDGFTNSNLSDTPKPSGWPNTDIQAIYIVPDYGDAATRCNIYDIEKKETEFRTVPYPGPDPLTDKMDLVKAAADQAPTKINNNQTGCKHWISRYFLVASGDELRQSFKAYDHGIEMDIGFHEYVKRFLDRSYNYSFELKEFDAFDDVGFIYARIKKTETPDPETGEPVLDSNIPVQIGTKDDPINPDKIVDDVERSYGYGDYWTGDRTDNRAKSRKGTYYFRVVTDTEFAFDPEFDGTVYIQLEYATRTSRTVGPNKGIDDNAGRFFPTVTIINPPDNATFYVTDTTNGSDARSKLNLNSLTPAKSDYKAGNLDKRTVKFVIDDKYSNYHYDDAEHSWTDDETGITHHRVPVKGSFIAYRTYLLNRNGYDYNSQTIQRESDVHRYVGYAGEESDGYNEAIDGHPNEVYDFSFKFIKDDSSTYVYTNKYTEVKRYRWNFEEYVNP